MSDDKPIYTWGRPSEHGRQMDMGFLRVLPTGSISVHPDDDWYEGTIARDAAEALLRELAEVLGFHVQQKRLGEAWKAFDALQERIANREPEPRKPYVAPAIERSTPAVIMDRAVQVEFEADPTLHMGRHVAEPRPCFCGDVTLDPNCNWTYVAGRQHGVTLCEWVASPPEPECTEDAAICDCSFHENLRRAERTH